MNMTKRLVRPPKLYFRDSGLLHSLLGVENLHRLYGTLFLGASWEAYVVEHIIRVTGSK
jgi:hypothetical protein